MRVFALLLLLPTFLQAQVLGGRIEGQVLDTQGGPLGGVALTLTGDSLPGGATSSTDDGGDFSFLHLPPGSYDLSAALEGFVTLEQTEIRVRQGRRIFLHLELLEALDEGEFLISGWSPRIDTGSTEVGLVLAREAFGALPLRRTWDGIFVLSPLAVPSESITSPPVAGAAPSENLFLMDALDVTDPVVGGPRVLLPWEFLAETDLTFGGLPAHRQGALGAVVDVVTRPGRAEFHGRAFARFTGDDFAASGRGEDFRDSDGGLTLGGPFGFENLSGFLGVDDRELRLRGESTDVFSYLARLDGRPSSGHRVTLSAAGDPANVGDRELGAHRVHLSYGGTRGRRFAASGAVGRMELRGVDGADRGEGRATGSWFFGSPETGSHELVLGGRLEEVDATGFTDATERAVFLEDRVRVGPWLTIHAGVRWEDFETESSLGGLDPGGEITPRVGFAWDLRRQGRSRLFGVFGRTAEVPPLAFLPSPVDPSFAGYDLPQVEEAILGYESEPLPHVTVSIMGLRRELTNRQPREEYEAWEVALRKRFDNDWHLDLSYVNTDDESTLGRRHQARLHGSWVWSEWLTTGAIFRYVSDAQPGPGETRPPAPDLTLLDLRLAALLPLDGPVEVELAGEIFNLLNERDGIVLSVPEPRFLRVGVDLGW